MPRAQCNAAARAPGYDRVACTEDCRSNVQHGEHIVHDTGHAHRHAHVSVARAVASELGGAGNRDDRLLSPT